MLVYLILFIKTFVVYFSNIYIILFKKLPEYEKIGYKELISILWAYEYCGLDKFEFGVDFVYFSSELNLLNHFNVVRV